MKNTLISKIKKYIDKNKGSVLTLKKFNTKSFEDYTYASIKRTINQLIQDGYLDQIMIGVYYKPKFIKLVGEYTCPKPEEIAEAIASKMKWDISITGERALNLLGLSTQVPNVLTYASTGPYKEYKINGNNLIIFKRCKQSELVGLSYDTKIIIQCLKTLGKNNISRHTIDILKKRLNSSTKKTILSESKNVTLWINQTIKEICSND